MSGWRPGIVVPCGRYPPRTCRSLIPASSPLTRRAMPLSRVLFNPLPLTRIRSPFSQSLAKRGRGDVMRKPRKA